MPNEDRDPADVDELLESRLEESEKVELLDEAEWQAYRNGEADLVALLGGGDIERILDERGGTADTE